MRSLSIAGAMLVVAFFGPWIDVLGLVQVSGWDLAREEMVGWKRHLLWLYPAGGLALAWTAWQGDRAARGVALAVGVFVVGLAAYHVFDGLVETLRYGAWLTIVGAAVAIAGGASPQRRSWALVAGAMVIGGFFLPWLGDSRFSMSGFDLARLEAPPSELGLPSPSWLFLIPILGAGATLAALTERSRRGAIVAGAGVLAVLAYLYIRGASLFLGWGAWLTLAAGACALIMSLIVAAKPAPAAKK
jgi:hypothetical protein